MMGGWAGTKGPAEYVFGGVDRRMTGGPSGHEGLNRDARRQISVYRLVRVLSIQYTQIGTSLYGHVWTENSENHNLLTPGSY